MHETKQIEDMSDLDIISHVYGEDVACVFVSNLDEFTSINENLTEAFDWMDDYEFWEGIDDTLLLVKSHNSLVDFKKEI